MSEQGNAESPDHYRVLAGQPAIGHASAHNFEALHNHRHEQSEFQNAPSQTLRDKLVDDIHVVRIPHRHFPSRRPTGRVGRTDQPPFVEVADGLIDYVGTIPTCAARDFAQSGKKVPHRCLHHECQANNPQNRPPPHQAHPGPKPPKS